MNNSNIFNRLDTINESLATVSERLAKLEKTNLAGKDSAPSKASDSIRMLPGIIENITASNSSDEVISALLETFSTVMDRSMVLSLKEGRYYPVLSRDYEPAPEVEPGTGEAVKGLLGTSADSRQILIIKGDISQQVPFASRDDSRIRYGIFIPIVFGDQVPLVYFGESVDSPDPDFMESVVNIATLAIKNLQLSSLLQKETIEVDPEPAIEAEEPSREPDLEEQPEAVEEIDDETAVLQEPESKPEIKDTFRKPFRSVNDFESDIISAEDLIKSFNIDIKEKTEDFPSELEADEIPDIPEETAPAEAPEVDDAEKIILEEEVNLEAESSNLEIEIPLDITDEDLVLPDEEVSAEIPPEFKAEKTDIEAELARLESEAEIKISPEDITAEVEYEDLDEPAPEPEPQKIPEAALDEALTFARLLVSEIKLYNEEQVKEGRKEGDLYQRLKEQIDLSRAVYNERIPEQVRKEKNYFDEELVRILAQGTESLLRIK